MRYQAAWAKCWRDRASSTVKPVYFNNADGGGGFGAISALFANARG